MDPVNADDRMLVDEKYELGKIIIVDKYGRTLSIVLAKITGSCSIPHRAKEVHCQCSLVYVFFVGNIK